MNHTPGPWECDTAGQPIIINGPEEGEANVIAVIYDDKCDSKHHYGEERAAANARVLTAAPRMLELIKQIVPGDPLWPEAASIIRSVENA